MKKRVSDKKWLFTVLIRENSGLKFDRGYFSKENIRYKDKCGYEFVIMMKGMKELVKSLVLEVKGTFEENCAYSIRDYKVSGITVKRQLYPSDEKERYFHIFYNDRKKSSDREAVEAKIDRMSIQPAETGSVSCKG